MECGGAMRGIRNRVGDLECRDIECGGECNDSPGRGHRGQDGITTSSNPRTDTASRGGTGLRRRPLKSQEGRRGGALKGLCSVVPFALFFLFYFVISAYLVLGFVTTCYEGYLLFVIAIDIQY